jgi:hypothetical protein
VYGIPPRAKASGLPACNLREEKLGKSVQEMESILKLKKLAYSLNRI